MRTETRKLQLAVTVSALEEKLTSGFVVVLEDTSELLRAQKAAAWHEVARRVAHEIKNPLTPIALSADESPGRWTASTAARDRPHPARVRRDISKSVESVKTLVDEFSQFARFPTAQPARCDLNEIVSEALLYSSTGWTASRSGPASRPACRRSMWTANSSSAWSSTWWTTRPRRCRIRSSRELHIATQPGPAGVVELVIADRDAA